LRADIDYGFTEAHTTYGVIGIKTWIYKGDILDLSKRRGSGLPEPEPRREPRGRDRRDRDRDRDRDRGGRPPERAFEPPVAAAPEPAGPARQAPPIDLPRPAMRTTAPILPPLMSPQQPSWKAEARQEAEIQPAETAAPEAAAPETAAPEAPPAAGEGENK